MRKTKAEQEEEAKKLRDERQAAYAAAETERILDSLIKQAWARPQNDPGTVAYLRSTMAPLLLADERLRAVFVLAVGRAEEGERQLRDLHTTLHDTKTRFEAYKDGVRDSASRMTMPPGPWGPWR